MNKYLTLFFLINNYIFCDLQLRFYIDGKRQNETTIKYGDITDIVSKVPKGDNYYERVSDEYATSNNMIKNGEIKTLSTFDIKSILKKGVISYIGANQFNYIKKDNIDDLYFYAVGATSNGFYNLVPIEIEDGDKINNFSTKLHSYSNPRIAIYALTNTLIEKLKSLTFTKIKIHGETSDIIQAIKVFNNEADKVKELFKNQIRLFFLINEHAKTIADTVKQIDEDLYIKEDDINCSISPTKLIDREYELINGENGQFLDYIKNNENSANWIINMQYLNYWIKVKFNYILPPGTELRETDKENKFTDDGFGCTEISPLPKEDIIKFSEKKDATKDFILNEIYDTCLCNREDDEFNRSIRDYTIRLNEDIDYPNKKEYTATVNIPENSEQLKSVFIHIDIPGKDFTHTISGDKYEGPHADDDLCKINKRYIIQCTDKYDRETILNKLESQIKAKRSENGLEDKISDEMIKAIVDKIASRTSLDGGSFNYFDFKNQQDVFASRILENQTGGFQPPTDNTDNNTPTTPTNKKNNKKFGNNKQKRCCCNCCKRCC